MIDVAFIKKKKKQIKITMDHLILYFPEEQSLGIDSSVTAPCSDSISKEHHFFPLSYGHSLQDIHDSYLKTIIVRINLKNQ